VYLRSLLFLAALQLLNTTGKILLSRRLGQNRNQETERQKRQISFESPENANCPSVCLPVLSIIQTIWSPHKSDEVPLLRQPALALPLRLATIRRRNTSHHILRLLVSQMRVGRAAVAILSRVHDAIAVVVAPGGALELVRAPGDGRAHLELLLLLAEVAAAEDAGSDPDDGDAEEEDDEHGDPFGVAVHPRGIGIPAARLRRGRRRARARARPAGLSSRSHSRRRRSRALNPTVPLEPALNLTLTRCIGTAGGATHGRDASDASEERLELGVGAEAVFVRVGGHGHRAGALRIVERTAIGGAEGKARGEGHDEPICSWS